MYQVFVNFGDTITTMVMVLHDKGNVIASTFLPKSDSQIEDIVNHYRYNKYKFVRDSLLDESVPDYTKPEFVEYTNYYFGNFQG